MPKPTFMDQFSAAQKVVAAVESIFPHINPRSTRESKGKTVEKKKEKKSKKISVHLPTMAADLHEFAEYVESSMPDDDLMEFIAEICRNADEEFLPKLLRYLVNKKVLPLTGYLVTGPEYTEACFFDKTANKSGENGVVFPSIDAARYALRGRGGRATELARAWREIELDRFQDEVLEERFHLQRVVGIWSDWE